MKTISLCYSMTAAALLTLAAGCMGPPPTDGDITDENEAALAGPGGDPTGPIPNCIGKPAIPDIAITKFEMQGDFFNPYLTHIGVTVKNIGCAPSNVHDRFLTVRNSSQHVLPSLVHPAFTSSSDEGIPPGPIRPGGQQVFVADFNETVANLRGLGGDFTVSAYPYYDDLNTSNNVKVYPNR